MFAKGANDLFIRTLSIQASTPLKKVWNEYGLISLLIVVSVSGYLLFSENKQDILAYTLDTLGERLVSLASDDAAKERIAAAFDRFSDLVQNEQVSSDHIESVAANVLNLSARGEPITAEEAELMLYMDYPEALPSPVTAPSDVSVLYSPEDLQKDNKAKQYIIESEFEELGTRLSEMLEFSETFIVEGAEAASVVHFSTDDNGIHVILDSEAGTMMTEPTFLPMARDLEAKRMVRWNDRLADERERSAERYAFRQKKLAEITTREFEHSERQRVDALTRIQRLGSLGVNVRSDSTAFSHEVQLIIGESMKEFEVMMEEIGVQVQVMVNSTGATNATDSNN